LNNIAETPIISWRVSEWVVEESIKDNIVTRLGGKEIYYKILSYCCTVIAVVLKYESTKMFERKTNKVDITNIKILSLKKQ